MAWYERWKPYVPVATRRVQAASAAKKLAKKEGRDPNPIHINGKKIASTFWGAGWCENLERYSDYANRLPRGRTYVRNGSVVDLQITRGQVRSLVSGSQVYRIKIDIKTLSGRHWKGIKDDCSNSVASVIDLLQGRFDKTVMQRLTRAGDGLFPQPNEIKLSCSCPDWAGLCKHLAATLYAVGSLLDSQPELLFTLRDVDHLELINQAVSGANLDQTLVAGTDPSLSGSNLEELFGIELDQSVSPKRAKPIAEKRAAKRGAARERKPAPAVLVEPAQPAAKSKRKPAKTSKTAHKPKKPSNKTVSKPTKAPVMTAGKAAKASVKTASKPAKASVKAARSQTDPVKAVPNRAKPKPLAAKGTLHTRKSR